MITVTVQTREEATAVIEALTVAGLAYLDDYLVTGVPPDAPDHVPGDGRNMELITKDENRARADGDGLVFLDNYIGPAFPPQPERNRDYQVPPNAMDGGQP
jgi:hypothetical protein